MSAIQIPTVLLFLSLLSNPLLIPSIPPLLLLLLCLFPLPLPLPLVYLLLVLLLLLLFRQFLVPLILNIMETPVILMVPILIFYNHGVILIISL